MAETGIYVYGIARDLPDEAMARAHGVGGAPVRVVADRGLAAVVSPVSLDEFGEAALRRNLEDLDWLEATARAHDTVVDAAAECAVTVPLGLATVYRGEDRLRTALRDRREEFVQALSRIAGRTEWGVKIYGEASAADEHRGGPEPGSASEPVRPGTSYLRQRGIRRQAQEEARREMLLMAERVDDELCRLAAASRLHRPQDPQLSGQEGWMILNAAYLVDDERADAFRAAIVRLAEAYPRIGVEFTGPWAPYSFATEEET